MNPASENVLPLGTDHLAFLRIYLFFFSERFYQIFSLKMECAEAFLQFAGQVFIYEIWRRIFCKEKKT